MITVDDIAGWFATSFNSDTGAGKLASLVPGLMVANRNNESASQPYGVFTVEQSGDIEHNSGFLSYPKFQINCEVYADQNTAADASAIQARFAFVFKMIPAVALALRNDGEFVQTLMPNAASAPLADNLRKANDVVVCRFGRQVRCVGKTNVG